MLANNTFKYQIISIATIFPLVNLIHYNFAILINLQYNDFKFKELLIDSDATIRFTSNISKLKVLQKIFSIELDKTIIRSLNFIFRIGSILSISIVILDIFLEIFVFYII